MTLTPKQIEDVLTDEDKLNYDKGRWYRLYESLAECRVENKRLKKEVDKAFQIGREIGLAEAVKIVKETKPEGGSRG